MQITLNSSTLNTEKSSTLTNKNIDIKTPQPSECIPIVLQPSFGISTTNETSHRSSSPSSNISSSDEFPYLLNDDTPAFALIKEKICNPDYPSDSNGLPIPQTFTDLIEIIRLEMGVYGLMDKQVNVPRLQSIIGNYDSKMEEWEKFAFFDEFRYTRNLVDDGNGKYNLLLLCWNTKQVSPIHDHSGSHCILKVMSGELTESLYEWPSLNDNTNNGDDDVMNVVTKVMDGCECCRVGGGGGGAPMKPNKISQLHINEAGYMHGKHIYSDIQNGILNVVDKLGLHRVGNCSGDKVAVSLHLYSPPIKTCKTFSEQTGEARKSGNCCFYSIRGEKSI